MERIGPEQQGSSLVTASVATATVEARITALQELAKTDPQAAQDATWAWFGRLGAQLPAPSAELELANIFATGDE